LCDLTALAGSAGSCTNCTPESRENLTIRASARNGVFVAAAVSRRCPHRRCPRSPLLAAVSSTAEMKMIGVGGRNGEAGQDARYVRGTRAAENAILRLIHNVGG
jgi:hypothetical protein